MATPNPDWLNDLPTLASDYEASKPAPAPTGIWGTSIGSGIASGFAGLGGDVARTGQALGTAVGAGDTGFVKGLGAFANRAQASQQYYDQNQGGMFDSVGGFAHAIASGLPTLAGAALAAGPIGEIGAVSRLAAAGGVRGFLGKAAAGGVAMLPSAIGGNVEAAEQANNGQLTQSDAIKALALGTPEALAMGYLPGSLHDIATGGTVGDLAKRALTSGAKLGAYQGVQAGAQTAITQQAFTPDMPLSDRAHEIVSAALSGFVQGGLFGGVTAALGGRRAPEITTADLDKATANIDPNRSYLPSPPPVLYLPPPPPVESDATNVANNQLGGPPPAPRLTTEPFEGTAVDVTGNLVTPPTPSDTPQIEPPHRFPPTTPVPSNLEAADGADVKAHYDQLTQLGQLPASDPNAIAREQVRQELVKRTPPGMPLGEGTLFSPQEAQARAPAVESLKDDLMPEGKAVAKAAAKDPFFQNFNAADTPDLVNAVQARAEQFLTDKEKFPAWFKDVAKTAGFDVETVSRKPVLITPEEQIARLNVELTQQQAAVETAKPIRGDVLQKANAAVIDTKAQIAKLEDIKALHDEAADRRAKATTEPTPLAVGGPDAVSEQGPTSVPVREPPGGGGEVRGGNAEGVDAPRAQAPAPQEEVPRWEAIAGQGPQVAPEGLTPNITPLPPELKTQSPEPPAPAIESAPEPAPPKTVNMRRRGGPIPDRTPDTTVKKPVEAAPAPRTVLPDLSNPTPVEKAVKEAPIAAVKAKAQMDAADAHLKWIADNHENPEYRQQARDALKGPPSARLKAKDDLAEKIIADADKRGTEAVAKIAPAPIPVEKPKANEPTPPPEWAAEHAKDLHGDVAYHDADHALIRGTSRFGKPVYAAVSRVSGLRSNRDIHSTNDSWLDPATKSRLMGVADVLRAKDASAEKRAPDGPFNGKAGQVVGSAAVDPSIVQYVQGLASKVGLGNARIFVHHGDTAGALGDAQNLNGSYHSPRAAIDSRNNGTVRQFGPNGADFEIYLNPNMSAAKTVETLAHEVGHIVQKTVFDNASAETQKAVRDAHQAWLKSITGATSEQLLKSVRNRNMQDELLDPTRPATEGLHSSYGYLTSFSEWFADNVSRWATTAEKPLGVVQKFFADLAAKMREFISAVTGRDFMPANEVKDFLDNLGSGDADNWFATRRGANAPSFQSEGEQQASMRPQEAEQRVKQTISGLNRFRESMLGRVATLPVVLRRLALNWQRLDGLVRDAAPYLPSGIKYQTAHEMRMARANAKNKADSRSMEGYNALAHEYKQMVDSFLGKLQNHLGLDPRKPDSDYADALKDKPYAKRAIMFLREMRSDMDRLRTAVGPDGKTPLGLLKVVNDILSMNQTKGLQENVAHMHAMGEIYAAKGIDLFGPGWVNPDERYRTMSTAHDDPAATQKFYRDTHDQMKAAIDAHLAANKTEAMTKAAEIMARVDKTDKSPAGVRDVERAKKAAREAAAEITGKVEDLRGLQASVKDRQDLIDKGTYSPLSRKNYDHFVSAKIKQGISDGLVDPKSMAAIGDALSKAGFGDIGLSMHSESGIIMAKVPSQEAMNRLYDVFSGLKAQGHMDELKRGHPDKLDTMKSFGTPFMQSMIAHFGNMARKVSPDAATAEKLHKAMVAQFMDTVSDNSILPNMQKREFTSGFDPNMGQAAAQRALNSSRASSQVSSRGEITAAQAAMNDEVERTKAQGGSEIAHDAAREIMRREAEAAWYIPSNLFDAAQSVMHTVNVGLNPAYTITALSQIPTLLHGELAKKFGYFKSAKMIGSVTPRAFKIMKAVYSSTDAAHFGVREAALRAAGISAKDIQTILKLDNAGGLTSYTQSMTELGHGHGSTFSKIKNWTNAMGVYAEQMPRIVAALAAGDLHDSRADGLAHTGLDRDAYVKHVVNESQGNWNAGQTSRMTSRTGPLGPYTRISLAFMQYQTFMLNKLYSEVHNVIAPHGADAKENSRLRREAGSFLMAHLAATVAIAGTLGLPFASAAAGAFDKLYAAFTGRDDMDIIGSYRTYLAHTFGPDVADVIAKGLPRAAGVDLSKLGDANLLPGTGFLTDKRKWEDASKDWFKSMAGSAAGEVGSMVLGARDLMNGDYMLGATKMIPEGFKGLTEGAYYSQHGFVDKDGRPLPVGSPTTRDLIAAVLGFDPTRLAQYNEAKRIGQGLEAQKQYREQNINQHLIKSQMTHDPVAFQKWLQEAVQFDREHVGSANITSHVAQDFQAAQKAGITARALRAPIGIGMLDPALKSTGFLSPQ